MAVGVVLATMAMVAAMVLAVVCVRVFWTTAPRPTRSHACDYSVIDAAEYGDCVFMSGCECLL